MNCPSPHTRTVTVSKYLSVEIMFSGRWASLPPSPVRLDHTKADAPAPAKPSDARSAHDTPPAFCRRRAPR